MHAGEGDGAESIRQAIQDMPDIAKLSRQVMVDQTPEGLRIFTAEPQWVGAPEAPGAQNGWNRTVYVLNPKKAGEVAIAEAPGQQNAWNRIILRAERGDQYIIVLRWERVAAESKLHAAGNQ